MAVNKHINDDEINELLRNMSLNTDANTVDESFAEAIMSQDYNVPVNEAKEKAMLQKLTKNVKGKGGSLPYVTGIVAVVFVGTLLLFWFNRNDNTDVAANTGQNNTVNTNHADNIENNIQEANQNTAIENKQVVNTIVDTFGKIKHSTIAVKNDSIKTTTTASDFQQNIFVKTPVLPYITDTDKKRYAKVKEQMLQKLYDLEKDLYTHVDANKLDYAGKPITIDAFSIRNVAITNLEYKTFLADLLVKNKQDDYFKAEVKSLQWKTEGYNELAFEYFENEKYNDYPVVNISSDAAKLFCTWMENELKQYMQNKKLKNKTLQIRLPLDKEWMLAARDGYAKISYGTGYNTFYDFNEGLVDYSFVKRIHLIKKRVKSNDTLFAYSTTNRYGCSEIALKAHLNKAFVAFDYLPVDTIYTERMKVFGKMYRVSEMVLNRENSHVWLNGHTWKTKEDYLAFEEKFKKHTVSPFVGFRVVVIDTRDAVYKNPFW